MDAYRMAVKFNLHSEILRENSKKNVVRVSRWIGKDAARFKRLMNLFLADDARDSRRASWVMTHCVERYPDLALPWIKEMIARCMEANAHDALQRNVMRSLQFVDVPKGARGIVVNAGFDILRSVRSSIAAKAFAMTVLARIARREPDLKQEIAIVLEEILANPGTAGLHARARRVLSTDLDF